jgi:hypothetical protein
LKKALIDRGSYMVSKNADEIIFSNPTKSTTRLANQIEKRGRTEESIKELVN